MKKEIYSAIALSTVGCAAIPRECKAEPKTPNLIVIMCDDLGYADVGFNGCTDIPTPNIDRIANEGVLFTNGYAAFAFSGPSRAGFITGRFGGRFGFERNPRYMPQDNNVGLPLTEGTIAESLQQVGYTTGIVGKWHLGATKDLHPLKRGFDEFFGHLGGGHVYFPSEYTFEDSYAIDNEGNSYRSWIMRNHEALHPNKTPKYLTDEFSDEAVKFVERHKGSPFFLYLAYNAPHTPLQAPEKYLERFPQLEGKRKTYAAMVSAVDDGVGALLEKLEDCGIADNTIIFFMSDNGGPEHVNASNNGKLKGGKGELYDGGIRVPFAMRYPVQVSPMVYDEPVNSFDVFGTIQAITNSPIRNPIDGVNLLPYLKGETEGDPHKAICYRYFDTGRFAVRKGDFKLVYMDTRWGKREESVELFKISTDVGETKNIAKKNPNKVKELQNMKNQFRKELISPIFEPLQRNKKKK